MLWTLLFACAFVEPPETSVALVPPEPVLRHIDAQRVQLQASDAGAELWRSIDHHGGLLRYRRVGPWTAHLSDGRTVAPGDPLHGYLTRPFSLADSPVEPEPFGALTVRLASGDAIHLDPVDRALRGWEQAGGAYEVEATRSVQGLDLIGVLSLPGGERIEVRRWEPADPLPGWPLDPG